MRKNMKKFLATALSALALAFTGGALATANFTAEAAELPQLYIRGVNLRLADNVQMMFAVESRNVETESVELLVWKNAPAEYVYDDLSNTKLSQEEATVTLPTGDEGLVYIYDGLAVKEMVDNIYVCAYAKVDGKEYYSDVKKCSIVEYSYNMLENIAELEEPEEGSEGYAAALANYQKQQKLGTVIEAMLHYGAAMQAYASYNTEAPADALLLPDNTESEKLVRVEVENATFEDGFNYGFFMSNTAQVVTPNYGYSFVDGSENFAVSGTDIQLTVPKGKSYIATGAFSAPKIIYEKMEDGNWKVTGIGTEFNGSLLVIPSEHEDGKKVTAIGAGAIVNIGITKVSIPSTITTIEDGAFVNNKNLSEIEVSADNAAYKSVDGNLYTKDGKTLCLYAIGKADTVFAVPTDVTKLGSFAFAHANNLVSMEIPAGLTTVAEDAFLYAASFSNVYYNGPASAWASVTVANGGNAKLSTASVYCYAEKTYWVEYESVLEEVVGSDGKPTVIEQTKVTLNTDEDVILGKSDIEIPAANSIIVSCEDIVKNFGIRATNTSRWNSAQLKVYASVAVSGGEYVWVEISDAFELSASEVVYNFTMDKPLYQCFKIENVSEYSATVPCFILGMYSA